MAKSELGTKRVDPETGKKFYDLGRDPIISPYTGKAYPLSYFESVSESQIMEKEVDSEDDIDVVLGDNEFISIDDNDETEAETDNLDDLDDEVTLVEPDESAFLEDSDDDDSDVKNIIGETFTDEEEM